MTIVRRILGGTAALAAAALLASGCGSSGTSTTSTEASATVSWADGVCSAVTSYQSALKQAATTLKGGQLSQEAVNQAADSVKAATQTFVQKLRDLGKPETTAGQKATETLTGLASDLQKDATAVQEATSSSSSTLSLISVSSTTLLTAQSQIQSAVKELNSLDPTGELKAAFSKASSCASLTS